MTAVVSATAALMWLWPSDSPAQAPFRLAVAVAAVAWLPGFSVIRAFGWFGAASSWRERLPLAFVTGLALIAVLHAAAAILHLPIAMAFAAIVAATLVAAIAPSRLDPPVADQRSRSGVPVLPLAALQIFVICGWMLEPQLTGEETVELITIRKLADNPFIAIDGIMPEPKAIPTYVITPYYLFVALVSKAAGVSIFAAYIKLRALYVLLAVLTLSALAARLFPRGGERLGDAAILAFLALFALDPDPWTWPASMFPLIRRGGFAAGVLAPGMMLALVVYVTTAKAKRARAEIVAPGLLLLALLTTHAMEIIYVGFFGLAAVVAAAVVRGSRISVARLLAFGGAAAVVALAYRAVHSRLAAHVYAFDRAGRDQAWAGLKTEFAQGLSSFAGISDAGSYLVSTSGAVVPFTLLGLACTPLLIRYDRSGGTVLWAAATLPLMVYASSKLFALLQLATSSEILFVFAYFTLCGAIALLTIGFAAAEHALRWPWLARASRAWWQMAVASMAAGLAGYLASPLLRQAAALFVAHPLALVWMAAIGGLVVLMAGPAHPAEAGTGPQAGLLLAGMVLGIAVGFRGFPGYIEGSLREPLPQTLRRAADRSSVLDWPSYYPLLQRQANPPIDLPAAVVSDLQQLLPPLQILAADPAHSFSLPVVLNQHIVNPGHVISTSLPYFERYAPLDAAGRRRHPLFNDGEQLTADERRFLAEYGVQYVLVNPANRERVGAKLSREPGFATVYDRDGFLLFRVASPPAGTVH